MGDEEVAAELGPDYDPPCSQLTYEADILNAKEQILEHRKKEYNLMLSKLTTMIIKIYFYLSLPFSFDFYLYFYFIDI